MKKKKPNLLSVKFQLIANTNYLWRDIEALLDLFRKSIPILRS